MKTFIATYFSIQTLFLITCSSLFGQYDSDILKDLPEITPKIFAPGYISTGMYERDVAITSDGNEIYYSLFQGDWNTIMVAKRINGVWQEPVVASFARDTMYFFAEPALSIDGNKIFFLSTKPRNGESSKSGWSNQNIWFAKRNSDGFWDKAQPLPQNINALDEFYPSLTTDGTLYFCRTDTKTKLSQILRSKLVDGVYQDPTVLPEPINGKGTIFNACIAPDESYLIGCVSERDSTNMKHSTYMLFFHNVDDTWSEGIDLVKELNLPCPNAISISVSPDGRILFFASTIKTIRFNDILPEWQLNSIAKRRLLPGNGNSDIYWMKIEDGFKKFRH